jgi:hypothetical protein
MAAAGVGLALMTATVVALPAAASETAVVQVQRGGIGQSDEYLAQALGVSADALEAAKQTAYQSAIDQALADGLITQAQADALKERSGMFGRFDGRMLHGMFGLTGTTIDPNALLADALGITTDELAAARVEAQSLALAAAVEAGDITQEQADQQQAEQALKSYLDEQGYESQVQTLYETLVQQAVQAGVITQEQADTILSDSSLGHFGGMRGLDGGRGGRHGFGDAGRMGPAGTDTATSDSSGL